MQVSVTVHEQDFDAADLQRRLVAGCSTIGGIVTFTGYVRREEGEFIVDSLFLEHYPGMTQRSIETIVEEACERWQLEAASVVHRVGHLLPGDQIVWVGAASRHRGDAFSACEFIMDYLKTRAPLWKKETGPDGERWVDARGSDGLRAARWNRNPGNG